MIKPEQITNYNLTNAELEVTILFWICAAGKNGTTAARLLDKFLNKYQAEFLGAFNIIRTLNIEELSDALKTSGIGCYTHKARTIHELACKDINLKTCTAEDLEQIYGIGMKTSRCFLMHSRKGVQLAGLDTHMLKNLRANGVKNVPKSTPSSKKQYKRLEQEVLRLSKEAGMVPAQYDLSVWNKYAVK